MKVLLLVCCLSVGLGLDIGPQLIRAVNQITGSTNNPTIDALALSIATQLRNAGVSDTRWVQEMLYQMRGAVLQVANDKQLFIARVNKGVRLGVIGANGRRVLLAKVAAGSVQPRTNGQSTGATPVSTRDVPAYMEGVVRPGRYPSSSIDTVTGVLRRAGFRDSAIATAIALLRLQTRLASTNSGSNPYGGVGGLEMYRTEQREFNRLAGVAYTQGIISRTTQSAISSFTGEQLQTWRQRTPEEIAENNRQRVAKNGDLIRRANALLNEIKELRRYIDSKNGFIQTGLGDSFVVQKLIGGLSARGRLDGAGGALNAALNMYDTNYQKVDKVKAAYAVAWDYITQLRPKGANTVEHLRQKREDGFDTLGKVASLSKFVPVIGKPLSLALSNLDTGFRYMSGDISGPEALARSLTSIIGGTLGKQISGTGSIVSQALRTASSSFISSLSVDIAKIANDPNLSSAQKAQQVRAAILKAALKALQSGVTKATPGNMSDSERSKLQSTLQSFGEKVGLSQGIMRPVLDKLNPQN